MVDRPPGGGETGTSGRQPQGSAEATDVPDAEELRRVAEEVRLAFPRPLRAPQLVLIDVDPRHMHAFWTLEPAAVDAARREVGVGRDASMVLRVTEGAAGQGATAFDVEVVGLQGQCYVDLWGEERCHRAELGLLRANGDMYPLAPAAIVQLPNAAPAGQAAVPVAEPARPPADPRPAEVNPPAAVALAMDIVPEPVQHPFPLPSTEPGEYDPEPRPVKPLPAAGDAPPAQPAASPRAPMPTAHDRPEPVRHPFPLPPTEAGEYDPEPRLAAPPRTIDASSPSSAAGSPILTSAAGDLPETARHMVPLSPAQAGEYAPEDLIGGFVAPSAAQPVEVPDATQSVEVPEARREELVAADHPFQAAAPWETQAEAPPPAQLTATAGILPLENVLTLSSFALGRDTVEFEVNAELHIVGRARPGMRLQLFGRPVTIRPDGSFSITRPLPAGALVFSSLLTGDDTDPSE